MPGRRDIRDNWRGGSKDPAALSNQQRISPVPGYAANVRHDFAHKASRKLVDSPAEVFVFEDLKVKNMTRAPKPRSQPADVYSERGKGQGRSQQVHTRISVGQGKTLYDVQSLATQQARYRHTAARHLTGVFEVFAHSPGQPSVTGGVRLPELWLYGKRRYQCVSRYQEARHKNARIWRNYRKASGNAPCG